MAKQVVQMLVTCTIETYESREEIRAEVERALTDHLLDPAVSLGAGFAALRQQVQQARRDYDEVANGHGDMTGHGAQEERAWGAVQALDEVLGMLADGERQEQLAADLGAHADLADPVHHGDVFSRIEASTEGEK